MGNVVSDAAPITTEEQAVLYLGDKKQEILRYMFTPIVFDLVLLGVFMMQVHTYFTYQRGDSWYTKGPVCVLVFLQLLFSGYHTWLVQWLFIEGYGTYERFFVTKGLAWGPFQDSLTSFVTQNFMAYRAYRLCNRATWIPITVLVLSLASSGASLATLIIFYNLNSLVDANRVFVSEVTWLASIMTADLIITGSIVYGLTRSKTGWHRTDKTITKLVRMTIEGQIPPLIIACAFLIEFIIEPSNLLGALLQNLQSKFYAVGMMYSINARISFQRAILSDGETQGQVFGMTGRSRAPTQIQVAVETETYIQQPHTTSNPYGRTSFTHGEADVKDYDESLDTLDNKDRENSVFNSQARLTSVTPTQAARPLPTL